MIQKMFKACISEGCKYRNTWCFRHVPHVFGSVCLHSNRTFYLKRPSLYEFILNWNSFKCFQPVGWTDAIWLGDQQGFFISLFENCRNVWNRYRLTFHWLLGELIDRGSFICASFCQNVYRKPVQLSSAYVFTSTKRLIWEVYTTKILSMRSIKPLKVIRVEHLDCKERG